MPGTNSEILQLLGIFSGIWFGVFSIAAGWYVWDSNRRDKENDRRFREVETNSDRRFREAQEYTDRRFREAEDNSERRFQEAQRYTERLFQQAEDNSDRRHQELLRAIGVLYQHVHADGSPAIIPLPDAAPVPAAD